MKGRFPLFFIVFLCTIGIVSCGKTQEMEIEETPDTTEQAALEEVEVEDYTVLRYSDLEILAYEDDTDAQVMLGRMLEYGTEDVKQDFSEAIYWYQMASDSGNVDGTCALGYFYLTGTRVEQDLDKALELFDLAIEGGSINAYVGKARVLLNDYNTGNTDEATLEEIIKTEDSSDEDEVDSESNVISDDEKAIFDLFHKAALYGDLDGLYYQAYSYESGIGVEQDYKRAFDYYQRVISSDSTDLSDLYAKNLANTALGLMYVQGLGVDVDIEQAIEYFQTASDNGYAKASYYLGQIYENGLGVDRDYALALEYYLQGADLDFAPALNQVGYMYYNGLGVDVDFASAVYYQKLAALQGYAIAQVNLGFLYENGYGVERNLETALSYYEMAADSGYEGAMEAATRVKAQINEKM